MLGKAQVREIIEGAWEETKANHLRLASCPFPHNFVDTTPNVTLNKRYRCEACGGEVDSHAYYWFEKGKAHARTYNV